MIFFKIGAMDLTAFEDIQNHNVNQTDVFQSWEDGNWTERRSFARTRIEGTVTLGFASAGDFRSFLGLLNLERQADGTHSISVYVHNLGETVETRAFLDLEGAAKWDRTNERQWQTVSISIKEA